jgi:hypothetical protein
MTTDDRVNWVPYNSDVDYDGYYKRLSEVAVGFVHGICEPDSPEYYRLWEPHKSRYDKLQSILKERVK